ncbi:putative O-linked N-acetylglucosamine transferase, SPINDLY family [Candidatus Burkholderia verschuerenii]|uniref:protein O-GlcNAc transferase n=1 Tax=Candidatus Burkholderia verschuerenii TaxID=242163 RepID=A0A0L0MF78_9BURK|nr:tetratricopeptide repeat protein [Candidatus Burkholderia verschuerenii]KND61352.1 putative O-linked N-acetylglucosamine transferase, SPINDLY family [Candidatus Burkholderia verschuerenii]
MTQPNAPAPHAPEPFGIVALDAEQQFQADIESVLQAALEKHRAFELHEAEPLYRLVLDASPHHTEANYHLGLLMIQRGQFDAAALRFEAAIGANPSRHLYWANYVDALTRSGQVAAAKLVLELAVSQGMNGPGVAALTGQLDAATQLREGDGTADSRAKLPPRDERELETLYAARRYAETIALAEKMTHKYPKAEMSWAYLGVAQFSYMKLPEAIGSLRRSLELNPLNLEIRRALADALRLTDRFFEAEAECRRIIEIDDRHPEAYRVLGLVLCGLTRLDDAQAVCRRAIELAPRSHQAHHTLGVVLMELTQFDAAEEHCRRALELLPSDKYAHQNLLFCLSHKESVDRRAYFEQHLAYAEHCEKPFRAQWKKHANSRDPERCIRVGFVSADFNQHPVANFIEPIFRFFANDPGLSVHAYYNRNFTDDMTRKLRSLVANWHDVPGLTDADLADQIRADGIDVLIDLTGHTAHNRLETFARKPAPVQATWMGYLGTTGMTSMDYYIADRFYVPEHQIEGQFVEKLAYLPAFAPFEPASVSPALNALPALSRGHLTFGSFNRFNKLRPQTVALWSELLRALPDARMLIAGVPHDDSYLVVRDWFAQAGIGTERIEFRQRASLEGLLAHHLDADIALDTFPYAGGVTTLQSLWMGVPTLTMPGDLIASRGSTSVMSLAGLTDFVATDRADFVARGVAWAGKLNELAQIRSGMRERCMHSPFFEQDTVAAGLSRGIRKMWQRWCAGGAPATFDA